MTAQPLTSKGNLTGLLNQVKYLRQSGSVSLQVTILTPSVGSKGYEESFRNGMVIGQAGNHKVEDYQFDGNHCVATHDSRPWLRQMNTLPCLRQLSTIHWLSFGPLPTGKTRSGVTGSCTRSTA